MKIFSLFLTIILLFVLSSCDGSSIPITANTTEQQAIVLEESNTSAKQPTLFSEKSESEITKNPVESNILVAYFSRVGNTSFSESVDVVASASLTEGETGLIGNSEVIADMVQESIGGDLFRIITVEPYPENYDETTDVALQEQQYDARPELKSHVDNMDDYDVIFLGYPIWWGTTPMAIVAFLEEYDFSGKTIVPFCTNEGSGLGQSVEDITELCPNSTISDGLAIRGSDVETAQDEVTLWLSGLGIQEAA
jgi:flavodoxin